MYVRIISATSHERVKFDGWRSLSTRSARAMSQPWIFSQQSHLVGLDLLGEPIVSQSHNYIDETEGWSKPCTVMCTGLYFIICCTDGIATV